MDEPDTRASDRDRDSALELLSTAASDGRRSLEECSARAMCASIKVHAPSRKALRKLAERMLG